MILALAIVCFAAIALYVAEARRLFRIALAIVARCES